MSLSASVPVHSAAASSGGAAGTPSAKGMMPEGEMSVFDILLQALGAETPVAPVAVAAPVADSDVIADQTAEDGADELPEIEMPQSGDAGVAAQVAMVVTPSVVQPQAAAGATPELPELTFGAEAKASKGKPEAKPPVAGGKDGDDVKAGSDSAETADIIEATVKGTAEPVRAAARGDAKAALSKMRDSVTGTEPQAAQPATDPRTVSAAAPDAQSQALPSAFSLQAISDTSGSYSATGASTTAGSNMSKAAVETLSALSMQISKKMEQGSTKFAIELYPADLGKVEVSLHIGRDGKTTAHLTFDSPVTAASFSASEPELRQQLANAGLSVDPDALSFSSRDGGGSFGSAMAQDQQHQSQARQANRALQAANKVADDSDLNAILDTAMKAMRTGVSTLALNLIV